MRRRGGTDADRLVRGRDVQRVAVGLGVDGDGGDAHAPCRLDDPAGDLAPIGHKDLVEHARPARRRCLGGRRGENKRSVWTTCAGSDRTFTALRSCASLHHRTGRESGDGRRNRGAPYQGPNSPAAAQSLFTMSNSGRCQPSAGLAVFGRRRPGQPDRMSWWSSRPFGPEPRRTAPQFRTVFGLRCEAARASPGRPSEAALHRWPAVLDDVLAPEVRPSSIGAEAFAAGRVQRCRGKPCPIGERNPPKKRHRRTCRVGWQSTTRDRRWVEQRFTPPRARCRRHARGRIRRSPTPPLRRCRSLVRLAGRLAKGARRRWA